MACGEVDKIEEWMGLMDKKGYGHWIDLFVMLVNNNNNNNIQKY